MPANPARAPECGAITVDLAGYLEAKFSLDERSLNADVRQAFIEGIACVPDVIRCLDAGTGTGATLRRLLDAELSASLAITALDQDVRLLDLAAASIAERLERAGYRTLAQRRGIEAERSDRHVSIEFSACDVHDFEPATPTRYDLVTAHAFMDIVPLATTLSRMSSWLAPGGLLYATLNYDGDTALFPEYRDPAFEAAVLARYNASMELRRVRGGATGGARSGRRLHAALGDAGFAVIAYGSSDWNITPRGGRYRDRDADVLRTLLAWVHNESREQPAIDGDRLTRWYVERGTQLERAELGMIVHQLDVLAGASP